MRKLLSVTIMSAAVVICLSGEALAQAASDVVCDQCVDKSDIHVGAVSTSRLHVNAVTTPKLRDGAVTRDKIDKGAVTTSRLHSNAVSTPKLRDGAVTSAKIADDAISSAKLQAGSVATANLADSAVTAAKMGLANTIYVEDSGNNGANCTALRTALNGLVGPAVVALGPGTFACGSTPVVIPEGISLIGSGENQTTITGSVPWYDSEYWPAYPYHGLITFAGADIALDRLTVVNSQGTSSDTHHAIELGLTGAHAPNWRINEVTVQTQGDGVGFGIVASFDCGEARMSDVTVEAEGYYAGIAISINCPGSASGTNLHALADSVQVGFATALSANGALTARNSTFTDASGSGYAVYGSPKLISSELVGDLSGSIKCVGNYDGTGVALSNGTFGSGGCI